MTAFPQLPPIAQTVGEAVHLLEEALDNEYRRSLRRTTTTASGIPKPKRALDLSIDAARCDAVADALSRVLGFRTTNFQLKEASYRRIGGWQIVAEETAKMKRLADVEADKIKQRATR